MSVAAVILAAGASRRLGRPKQSLQLGGETLLERALRTAREAALSPIIVVVDPDGEEAIAGSANAAAVIRNQDAAEGIASSIRCGVEQAKEMGVSGVVLMTCDQVTLTPGHLHALIDNPGHLAGSAYAGKIGIPAYFPAASFPELLALRGDTGARELLRGAASVTDESLTLDIDTQEDFDRARKLLERA